MEPLPSEPVWIDYTNYRGERAWRRIREVRRYWGSTEYHPEHQELMDAIDLERGVEWTFAVNDIHDMRPDRPPGTRPA
jgi:hypothetical protein